MDSLFVFFGMVFVGLVLLAMFLGTLRQKHFCDSCQRETSWTYKNKHTIACIACQKTFSTTTWSVLLRVFSQWALLLVGLAIVVLAVNTGLESL